MKQVREGYKMTELGEIPTGWDVKSLEQLSEKMYQGINTVADRVEYKEKGYKILQAKHITKEYFEFSDVKYVSENDYQKYKKKYKPNLGDILISNIGTIGKVLLIKDDIDLLIAWNIFLVKLSNEIDCEYISYCLRRLYNTGYYDRYITGNATKFVNKTIMKNIPILVPPLPEQKKIASILSKVDEQIELTDNLIEKTKDLKKGLMQNLLTKGIGHTEFKETEIGKIPTGWDVKRLEQITDVRDGTHDSPKYSNTGIPFITSKNLKEYGIDFTEVNYISNDDHEKFSKRSKVDDGDIIFGMIGTIGNPVIVKKTFDFSIKNVALIKFNKDNIKNTYILNLLKSETIKKQFNQQSNGGEQKFVSLNVIRKLEIPVPSLEEQKKIASILSSVDNQIEEYQNKKSKLEELKKGLMQQLLTGKIRVKVDSDIYALVNQEVCENI